MIRSMLSQTRWMVAWLLFAGGMINYMDRSALSIAAPLVSKDLHFDPGQLGIILSSFFFGYAIFNFVGGYSSDKLGPKTVLTLAMILWSIFCGLTGAAIGFASMLVIRIIFGIGEGPFSAVTNKMVHNWFPHREQASAVGISNAGTPLGGAISGPIVGFIATAYSWRASFIVVGLIGLAWTVVWMFMVTNRPDQHPRISQRERDEIARGREAVQSRGPAPPLSFYLRQPTVIVTGLAFFGYAYILYFFLAWFPSYLTMEQHLSIKSMSIVNVIPWLLGFVGLAASGFVSDYAFRRTGNALFARKVVLVTCLLISAVCVALAGITTGVVGAVTLMAVAVFFLYLTASTYWAIILDTVRTENVGGTSGFVHFIANCAGIIGPAVTGYIVEWTGSFTSAFILAGAIATVGALAVAVWVRPLEAAGGAARTVTSGAA